MTNQKIDMPDGTPVTVKVTENGAIKIITGKFAGFLPVGQIIFLVLQSETLESLTQTMLPLHTLLSLDFSIKLTKLNIIK